MLNFQHPIELNRIASVQEPISISCDPWTRSW